MITLHVGQAPLDLPVLESFGLEKYGDDGVGALVIFAGVVRRASQGPSLTAMTYDGHPRLIARGFERLEHALREQQPAAWNASVQFRLGRVPVGAASLIIATISAHRPAAYEMNRAILEGIKLYSPIWKCEHFEDGQNTWLDGRSLREPPRETP